MKNFYKRLNNNPFLFIIYFLIGILILGFSINIIVLNKPEASGKLMKDYSIQHAFLIPSWDTELFDFFQLRYPSSALLVPLYDERETILGVTIIGNGKALFTHSGQNQEIEKEVHQVFIPLSRQTFDLLLLHIEGEDEVDIPKDLIPTLHSFLEHRSKLYFSIDLYGFTRLYTPSEDDRLAMIKPANEKDLLYYYETKEVRLVNEAGAIYTFSHPSLQNEYPPIDTMRWAHILIILLLTISFLVISILTLDSHQKRTWEKIKREVNHPSILYLLLLFLLFLFSNWIIDDHFVIPYHITLPLALSALLLMKYVRSRFGLSYLGLSSEHMIKDLFAAIFLSILLQIVATQSLPQGIKEMNYGKEILDFLYQFMFIHLFHELFWRGILQNTMERYVHRWISLLITTSLISLFTLLIHWNQYVGINFENIVILPFTFLLIGFFYQRTRNMIATALLTALLNLWSEWIIF